MKLLNRVLLIVALLGASMLGGFLANRTGIGAVQASPMAAFGPPQKITLLDVPNASTNPDVFGTTAVKIADVGTFTVENSASLVEVVHRGRLLINAIPVGTGVYFELRVDDANGVEIKPGQPSGLAVIRSTEAGQYISSNFSGYWEGLEAGEHTVSIWARANGTGDNAIIDPGGWNSNIVVIHEYLPFGSNYLPSITR